MNKSQKIWLWVSLGAFFIPEIFFSFILSFIAAILGLANFHFLYEYFINPQFFIDHSQYLFFALIVEFFGAFGFLVWNIKFNHMKSKLPLTILGILVLIFLTIVFLVGYSVANMSFP